MPQALAALPAMFAAAAPAAATAGTAAAGTAAAAAPAAAGTAATAAGADLAGTAATAAPAAAGAAGTASSGPSWLSMLGSHLGFGGDTPSSFSVPGGQMTDAQIGTAATQTGMPQSAFQGATTAGILPPKNNWLSAIGSKLGGMMPSGSSMIQPLMQGAASLMGMGGGGGGQRMPAAPAFHASGPASPGFQNTLSGGGMQAPMMPKITPPVMQTVNASSPNYNILRALGFNG